jgi:hypothetical protein
MNEILVKEVVDAVDVVFVLENAGELSDHFLIRLFDRHPSSPSSCQKLAQSQVERSCLERTSE